MRDEFAARTKQILGGRAGWRCSNPDCRASTSGPTVDPLHVSNVGVAAHITAAASGGPRFDPRLHPFQRLAVANGIWLCSICAKMVDDDPDRYDSATLRYWREDAETLADYEKGMPKLAVHPVRFASIQIDSSCLWRPAHRLHKVWTRAGGRADFGFHEISARYWKELRVSPKTKSLDPILDVTIANDTDATTVISAIGFEPIAVWTALKGLPVAYKVPVVDAYTLRVRTLMPGRSQIMSLPDPIAVPRHGTGRYKLCLKRFREAIRGNETLVRLCLVADTVEWKSRLIYMGVY